MKVTSKITKVQQEIPKADFNVLIETGHAKNFTIDDAEDKPPFTPAELVKTKKTDTPKEA